MEATADEESGEEVGAALTSDGEVGDGIKDSAPIIDVNTLPIVDSTVASQIKAACGIFSRKGEAHKPELTLPQVVTKPGTERWPVKTGQDPDRDLVGKNLVNGQDLGAGIVITTVEELISFPRPLGLENLKADPPEFQSKRAQPAETTIWQLDATITVLNQETDGDYHLVIQGASGATMVAEVPTPTAVFLGDSPWLENIKAVRTSVDNKLVQPLSPATFLLPPGGKKLVPKDSIIDVASSAVSYNSPHSFVTDAEEHSLGVLTFQTAVPPTKVRIIGVGFFDRAHGATGAGPNAIELHPVLKIVWL